jgi:hypothetical protein
MQKLFKTKYQCLLEFREGKKWVGQNWPRNHESTAGFVSVGWQARPAESALLGKGLKGWQVVLANCILISA